uniref:Dynein axonemal intermediate chain 4 n=1 Tax=Phaeomonas parva TaxID=124430 RepID=A0A7S1XLS0_9STRA|mmetsp:Transcript_19801/g.60013  ORF Transcript_19801/g.60013 Transcript_19801/m.60013 type:complete len:1004 (+) Transcript_19801:373-3384(+)
MPPPAAGMDSKSRARGSASGVASSKNRSSATGIRSTGGAARHSSGAARLSGGASGTRTRGTRHSRSKNGATHASGYRGDGRKPPVYLQVDGERRNVTPKSLLRGSTAAPAPGDGNSAAKSALQQTEENANPNPTASSSSAAAAGAAAGAAAPPTADANSGNMRMAKSHAEVIGRRASISAAAGPPTTSQSHKNMGGMHRGMSRLHTQRELLKETGPKLAPLEVTLSETATATLLHIPSMWEASDSPNVGVLREDNARYEELLQRRATSDNFGERHTQTLTLARKEKAVSCEPVPKREVATMATTWDIHDAQMAAMPGINRDDDPSRRMSIFGRKGSSNVTQGSIQVEDRASEVDIEVGRTVATTLATGCLLDVSEATTQTSTKDAGVGPGVGAPAAPQGGASAPLPATTEMETQTDGVALDADALMFQRMSEDVLHSEGLSSRLLLMERSLQQGRYHGRHLEYRNHPSANPKSALERLAESMSLDDELGSAGEAELARSVSSSNVMDDFDSMGSPKPAGDDASNMEGSAAATEKTDGDGAGTSSGAKMLDMLWKHECVLTSNRSVSCMAYSKGNPDVLAVGYGEFYFDDQNGGAVLFWSLRNPEFPERIIEVDVGVTAIDFSSRNPSYVAIGLYNGAIQVYDTRSKAEVPMTMSGMGCGLSLGAPVLESQAVEGQQHMEPVWQLKWTDRGERGEVLVSISTDGRVLEWSLKKGLSVSPLMELKRYGDTEGVISRTASGLCLDFPRDDASIYFAGTEDGHIHKCSCSYNEAYLESYTGHEGPVYRIATSPFDANTFLSCSADWTVKIWHDRRSTHVINFHTVNLSEVVNDVAWSPFLPCLFASVTGDGRVEVWDFEASPHDPISTLYVDSVPDPAWLKKQEEEKLKASHIGANGDRSLPGTRQTNRTATTYDSAGGRRPRTEEGKKEEAPLIKPALTCLAFSDNAPILAVGDAHGGVSIFRLGGDVGASHAKSKHASVLGESELEQVQKRVQRAMFQQEDDGEA